MGPMESSLGLTLSPVSHQPSLDHHASTTGASFQILELPWLHLLTPLSGTFILMIVT